MPCSIFWFVSLSHYKHLYKIKAERSEDESRDGFSKELLRSNEKVPKEIRQLDLMNQLLLCQVESIEVDMLKTSKYRENPIRCLVIMLKVVGGEHYPTTNYGYKLCTAQRL